MQSRIGALAWAVRALARTIGAFAGTVGDARNAHDLGCPWRHRRARGNIAGFVGSDDGHGLAGAKRNANGAGAKTRRDRRIRFHRVALVSEDFGRNCNG